MIWSPLVGAFVFRLNALNAFTSGLVIGWVAIGLAAVLVVAPALAAWQLWGLGWLARQPITKTPRRRLRVQFAAAQRRLVID